MLAYGITILVFVTPAGKAIPITASPGAHETWATFLRADEVPQASGLWLMRAWWIPDENEETTKYHLVGWKRPSLMDYAQMNQGTWRIEPRRRWPDGAPIKAETT